MSWVALSDSFEYLCYKYFYSYSAMIDFSGQNLTSLTTEVDPRAVRANFHRCLFFINSHIVSSFEAGDCVSNSSFK